jgi:hypothetical protein
MAATNTTTTLINRLKKRYNVDGVSQLVPVPADLIRRARFRPEMAPGENVEFDVQMALELGFTQGEGALNGSIAQISEKAKVDAFNLTLQSRVSYSMIERARKNEQAFARFGDSKFIPMVDSFRMREEFLALLGRRGIGKVTNNSSGTLTISEDTWNATLACSIIGAVLNAYDARTGGSQHNGDLTVTSVNVTNRTITVSGTNAAVVNGDYLFFKGDYDTGRIGLLHIAHNTGTLFNINAATYPLWQANSYDVGTSPLTLGKILQAAGKSAAKGCVGKKLVCYVPVMTFQGLVGDEAALVQYGAGRRKAERGFDTITFIGANGEIEVVPHLYMPDGEFVMWPEEFTYIIGSTEATSQLSGDSQDIIFDLEGYNYKEMRMFSDTCGVFCERPGWITYGTRSDSKALHAS